MANKRRLLALGLFLVVGSLTACSSGDGGGGNLAVACKANVEVADGFNKLFSSQAGPGSGPPSAEDQQRIKDTYTQKLARPLDDAAANAPDAIKPDIQSAVATLRTLGDTGDLSFFSDPAFGAKGRKINLYFYDHCSGPKQAVEAVDYAFNGVPNKLPSGAVQLKLTNKGTEEHEALVLTRKPGVTETFDEILALPKEEGQAKTQFVGQTMASPGQPDASVFHLTPGQYIMICTIPQGTVGQTQGDGPPHFTMGMKREFTVA